MPKLTRGLRAKLDTLMEALNEQFGTSAEFDDPKGGIFLWVKLPDHVDTLKLYQAALAAGVAINPGPEWSHRQGLCRQPVAAVLRQSVASSRSATASPCWPRSAVANSACRRGAPMWRSTAERDGPRSTQDQPKIEMVRFAVIR